MSLSHNKKRNVGLLREFFSKHIASCFVDKNKVQAEEANIIWSKYMKSGTELQKEMRLVSALMESKFDNKQIAYDFLMKVKQASKSISEKKLEREKTFLLREIHNKIEDTNFFNRNVSNYVEIASIQLLLNNWIKEDKSIDSQNMQLEDKVLNLLCNKIVVESKHTKDLDALGTLKESDQVVDSLVVNIMNEKFNKKFAGQLTESQKYILREFIFEDNQDKLKEKMISLKEETLSLLEKEVAKKSINAVDRQRFQEIKSLLETDYSKIDVIEEANVIFYMSISKLNEELKEDK